MNTLMIIASLILLSAPVIYITRVAQGHITPNPVTFLIRSVVAAINMVTYFFVAGRDPFKASVALVSTLGLTTIFVYSFRKGKFSKINGFDISLGVISFAVAILWKLNNDPVIANLCLQSAMLLAFVPTIRAVLAGVTREQVLPWALPTLSYTLMIYALSLSGTTTWQQLVNPFVGMIGNGGLMLAVACKQKSSRP